MSEDKTGNDFLEIAKVSAGNLSGALDAVKGAECLPRSALKRIREFRKDLEEALDGEKEPEIISIEELKS